MEYDNYIFDLYGTLCDIKTSETKLSLWKKMAEIYSAYGAFYSCSELKRMYRKLCTLKVMENASNKDYEPDVNMIFAELFSAKGVRVCDEVVRAVAITFRALSRDYLRLYPGVIELLDILKMKGKKIYLLSNAQSDFTRPEIGMLGIEHYFDGIFISSEQGVRKPGRDFFERLIKTYSLDVKRSVMIGNDEGADIVGAKACGMDSVYIHTDISPKEYGKEEPTYRIMDGDFCKLKQLII